MDPREAEEFISFAIDSWREAVGIEKFTFVGHSLGAYVAAAYAVYYRERLERCVGGGVDICLFIVIII